MSRLAVATVLLLAACGTAPEAADPRAAAVPERPTAVPPAFRGRWALVPADCEPNRPDAKGLMVVEANRLSFYESRAVPEAMVARGPDRLTARLRFAGEGQEWTHLAVLTLSDAGRTLTRDEKEADTGILRYARCPGDPR